MILFICKMQPHHTDPKKSLDFISKESVELLHWPVYSPDLNIIENVCPMIAEQVYKSPQFRAEEDLWVAIQVARGVLNNTKKDIIVQLFNKYSYRVAKLFANNGDIIN